MKVRLVLDLDRLTNTVRANLNLAHVPDVGDTVQIEFPNEDIILVFEVLRRQFLSGKNPKPDDRVLLEVNEIQKLSYRKNVWSD